MRVFLKAALVSFLATGALAHSPLERTMPENGAQLAHAPTELVLNFKRKLRLTRVSWSTKDSVGQIDISNHKDFATDFGIALEPLPAGQYEIEWRGLSDDGHAQRGRFSFTIE